MKTIFASILVLAACSGDPLSPGSGADPGEGTNTLLVEGNATAEPNFDNAKNDTDFRTDFSIHISLNGQSVTTGTVKVSTRFGEAPLTWDPNSGNNGRWRGSMANYDQVYQFDIISGNDKVTGVIVDGPDIHVFTAPTQGATLDSTVANPLKWDRDNGAQIATFNSDTVDRLVIEDTGGWMMGIGVIRADRDQVRENQLELRRTNHIVPAGAVGGSDFAVTVVNQLTVLAAPNPAL
jgi:hypothetical protein